MKKSKAKIVYIMNMMTKSGQTTKYKASDHLLDLKNAKTVILFGSFMRSDWYKNSDLDVFIYGNPEGLKIAEYESKLHREIQLFICQNKKDLNKFGTGLIRNIIKGNIIKGDIDFLEVNVNA